MPPEVALHPHLHDPQTASGPDAKGANNKIPLVSVIVRSMGRASLQEALDSIARQSYSAIEVLVVNAKGQGHPNIPERVGSLPLHLIDRGHPLPRSAAANAGIDAAQGEYLIFLDDDDLFEATHIAALIATLADHPEAKLAYADVRVLSADNATIGLFNQDFVAARLWSGNFLPIHAVLFHRSIVQRGCRFDEALDSYEDWDFWLQASQFSTFIHCPNVGAIYRIGLSQSGMATNAPDLVPRQREARRLVWRKWWPRFNIETFGEAIDDLKNQLTILNQSAAAATWERDQLRNTHDALHEKFLQLEQTAAKQSLQITQLEETLGESHHQNTLLQQTIDALLRSTSWRVTAPLRAAGKPIARYRHLLQAWRARHAATGGDAPTFPALLFKTARTLLHEGPAGIRLRTTALQSIANPPGPLAARINAQPTKTLPDLLSLVNLDRYQTFFIDVFDTAVIRTWRAPTDVFGFLAAKKKDAGFPKRRIERETKTRAEFRSQREITLLQIYAGLPDDDINIEIEAELHDCVANPAFRQFYESLIAKGKTVYFVSDMYLDKSTVSRILNRCGYSQYADLFVSSEDQLLKGDGSRFIWLKSKFPGCEQQAIHIGDHPIADHAQPSAHGFATHRLPSASEWFANDDFISSKWPALQENSSLGQSAILGLFRLWKSGFNSVNKPSYWHQFGFFYGGALVSAFCGHIHAELKRRGLNVSRLFFLARDGDILSRVYRELYEHPDPVYTLASRRCMSFAALYSLSEADDQEQMRLFTTSLGVSEAKDIFERFGYPDLTDLENDLLLQQSQGEAWTDDNILAVMQQHRDVLLEKAAAERATLLDYLRHIGFFDEKDAVIIDVGWSGSIQNALHKMIARETAGVPQLHGMYLGVYREALHKQNKSGFLFDGAPAAFAPYLNLIELLTASPQDGVIRIQRNGDTYESVPARRTEHEAKRQEISAQIQRGILDFAMLARQRFDADLGFLSPKNFELLFSVLRTHTSETDVAELGSLRHAMTLGNHFDQYVLTGT